MCRQLNLRICIKKIRNMDQFSGSLADCTGYFRVAVPEAAHRNAGKEIEVFFSGVIP